jgi:hypothetical protein
LVFIGTGNVRFGSTHAGNSLSEANATPGRRIARIFRLIHNLLERRIAMNTTPIFPGFETLVKPFKFPASPYEYKVTALRECPTPDSLQQCETPDKAADYWRMHIATHPHFNPECECLAVLLLNTRRKVKGHHIVSIGTMDTILVHPSGHHAFTAALASTLRALSVRAERKVRLRSACR